jgi:hypothetical protein
MATRELTGAFERADHPRPAPTARSHYAAARRYENAARSLSTRITVRSSFGGALGEFPADEIAALKAQRDDYHRLVAAYRSAGWKRERAERRAANRRLFRQEPARYMRLAARDMASTVRSAVRRIVRAVSA